MRIVADVIDNIFGSIRLFFLLGFGVVFLFGLVMTFGATVIAPKAVDAAAEHVERLGERAIEERRNYELGKEGWGYDKPRAGSGAKYQNGEYVGGWGDEAQ